MRQWRLDRGMEGHEDGVQEIRERHEGRAAGRATRRTRSHGFDILMAEWWFGKFMNTTVQTTKNQR